jgi:hypothetical protein
MEPQMIDHYNELPHSVNVIERMNEELSETQNENEKLKNKLEKLKDEKHNEPILLSLYNNYCKTHHKHIKLDEEDWGNEVTESKLEWFHKYSHVLEELDIADMDHFMSEYWGWVNYDPAWDSDIVPEEGVPSPREQRFDMLGDEALDFEKSLREKAEAVMQKHFDPEYKTRLYSWDEVMDTNYMYR